MGQANILFLITTYYFPDDSFLRSSVVNQMIYLYLSTTMCRLKYYHAWVLSDAINNLSGFGFNGFTSDGKQKWDLLTNVDIMGFEVFTNLN